MPQPTQKPSPQVCPLCGQANQCAMELERVSGLPQGPCWCTDLLFGPELLARIPPAARGIRCVCAACVKAGAAEPDATAV